MGGDHYLPGLYCRDLLHDLNASCAQLGEDGLIVHQVAQNAQGLDGGLLQRQGNGVTHAETHAQMLCS